MKLYYSQGLSITEVAETMQLTISNAYTVKHRILQKLKQHVTKLKGEDGR
jgi:DNA-directed RNA polymerase specialized sigma24 family protein